MKLSDVIPYIYLAAVPAVFIILYFGFAVKSLRIPKLLSAIAANAALTVPVLVLNAPKYFFLVPQMLMGFVLSLVFLDGNFSEKLLITIFSHISVNVTFSVFRQVAKDWRLFGGLSDTAFSAVITGLSVIFSAAVFAVLIILRRKFSGSLRRSGRNYIISVLIIAFVSLSLGLDLHITTTEHFKFVVLILLTLFLCATVIGDKLNTSFERSDIERREAEKQSKALSERAMEAKYMYDKLSKTNHAVKNYIIAMKSMCRSNQLDRLKEFIEKLSASDICAEVNNIRTGSVYIDAVINTKLNACELTDIRSTCVIAADFGGCNEIKLANLLCELLDCGFSCFGEDAADKRIRFEASRRNGFLILSVKAGCGGGFSEDSARVMKKASLRRLVSQLDGNLMVSCENGELSIDVML